MKKNQLARVRQTGVKDQVFAQIRDQIMDHTWPPGAKIPSEKTLAETLGVSRVSIREALHMLASLGLLESRHGEGTFVREYTGTAFLNTLLPSLVLDKLDILQVLEYRKIAEKGNVALAVERAGSAEIEELERSLRIMEENKADPRAFADADLSFHFLVAKATGNCSRDEGECHHRGHMEGLDVRHRGIAGPQGRTLLPPEDPGRDHQPGRPAG